MVFDDIIGHEVQKSYLRRVLEHDQRAHAYAFLGPRGAGKMAIAKRLVATLLEINVDGLASHPDVTILGREDDDKGNKRQTISIEAVKEACERLGLSAVHALKVVIVDDADTMTVQAQNALLKTLEEPQGQSLVILLAEDRSRLLPTILSRVVSVAFVHVPTDTIKQGLLDQGYTSRVAEEAARLAGGRPGIAMQYADADQLMAARRERTELERFIDAPLYQQIKTLSEITKGDDALSAEARFAWLDRLTDALHERLIVPSGNQPQIVAALQAALGARQAMRENVSPALALERIATNLH